MKNGFKVEANTVGINGLIMSESPNDGGITANSIDLGNKNIFENIVESLKSDALELQKKLRFAQQKDDYRTAIDCIRMLKDVLTLIKEYDWKLMYSEYETDGQKQVSVWEQNHCGEIKNHKIWNVQDNFIVSDIGTITSKKSSAKKDMYIDFEISTLNNVRNIIATIYRDGIIKRVRTKTSSTGTNQFLDYINSIDLSNNNIYVNSSCVGKAIEDLIPKGINYIKINR